MDDLELIGGFHSHGGTPLSLDGLFHGKSPSKLDDLGVALISETTNYTLDIFGSYHLTWKMNDNDHISQPEQG